MSVDADGDLDAAADVDDLHSGDPDATLDAEPDGDDSGEAEPDGDTEQDSAPPLTRIEEGLVVLYTFEEGDGATIRDVSGNDPPIDLTIENTNFVSWTAEGLEMNQEGLTIAHSIVPPSRLFETCQKRNALTTEAWVVPSLLHDDGPGRIVTFSESGRTRNFTLGQGSWDNRSQWMFRLRTDGGDALGNSNGMPQIETHDETTSFDVTHIVFTHSQVDEVIRGYINGYEVGITDTNDRTTYSRSWARTGGYSTWDSSYNLALGWEIDTTTDITRAWVGTYKLVAIYCRALSDAEVEQNFHAGP